MIRLTREQIEEAVRHPDGVECEGEGTEKTFILIDAEVVRRMRQNLYDKDVHTSLSDGINDMQAGRILSATEADELVRAKSGLPGLSEA